MLFLYVYLKGNKLEQSVAIDTMIDSCQLEISRKLTVVISGLLNSVLQSLSNHLIEKETLKQELMDIYQLTKTDDEFYGTCPNNDNSQVGKDCRDLEEKGQGQDDGEFYECSDAASEKSKMSKTLLRHKLLRLSAPTFWSDVVESNLNIKKQQAKPVHDRLDITWNLQVSGLSAFFCHEKKGESNIFSIYRN